MSPSTTVRAKLTGLVNVASQRQRAERDALAVPGVASVHKHARVLFPISSDDVAERITNAIGLDAIDGAASPTVAVDGDVVTLSGTVPSREDRETALAAAELPGVTDVRDEIRAGGAVESQCSWTPDSNAASSRR